MSLQKHIEDWAGTLGQEIEGSGAMSVQNIEDCEETLLLYIGGSVVVLPEHIAD